MFNFSFLVSSKSLKIQRGIFNPKFLGWRKHCNVESVTFGEFLNGPTNLKNQGEVIPLKDSLSFSSQSSL